MCKHKPNCTPFDDGHHVNQIAEHARPLAVRLKDLGEASLIYKELRLVKNGLLYNKWDAQENSFENI